MRRLVLVSVYPRLVSRAAVLEEGELIAFESEQEGAARSLGDIHLGTVARSARSMDGVFLRLAGGAEGFLHRSDVLKAAAARPGGLLPFPPSRDLCTPAEKLPGRNRAVLVQVKREAMGGKCAQLTTDVSLPGRRLVLRPYRPIRRITRELEDRGGRNLLHRTLRSLPLPQRAGVILRTAGLGAPQEALERELEELVGAWNGLVARAQGEGGPCLLHREPDLLGRLVRDSPGAGAAEFVTDCEEARKALADAAAAWEPGKITVRLHEGPGPLFHSHGVEKQVSNLYNHELPLPGGGTLVIEYSEALVAADVNSGPGRGTAEETALRANLEAAEALFLQLGLRDAGGLIVCDFIGMKDAGARKRLEERLRELARRDRAHVWLGPLSRLGFAAFTRQSRRSPEARLGLEPCPVCRGERLVPNRNVAAAWFLDELRLRAGGQEKVIAAISPEVLAALEGGDAYGRLRELLGRRLVVKESPAVGANRFAIR